MRHSNAFLRPLVLCIAASLGACMSLPAAAGVTCQLLDPNGNDIGDGGADIGDDTGGNANATACGRGALATSAAATAFGQDAQATGIASVAAGIGTRATGSSSTAVGAHASASAPWAIALGRSVASSNWGTIGIGAFSVASGKFSTAIGALAQAEGANSSAFGGFLGDETNGIELERFTRATGARATAFGAAAHAFAADSSALGTASQVLTGADRSVALGAQSIASQADTVSLGHSAGDLDYMGNAFGSDLNRRLTHVSVGTGDTDAVNVSQLHPLATALGAGASYAGGVFAAPDYTIQGNHYNDVGAAFAAVDARLTLIGGGSANAIEYDDPGKATTTLQGASGTTISNLAPGVAATDAVNKSQMETGDAATLQSANDYARTQSTGTLQAANAYTDSRVTQMSTDFTALRNDIDRLDRRFGEMDRRLDRLGAMSGAMSAAAMNTAGLAGDNRMGIGVGSQGGRAAMAVGYQRLVNSRISVSLSAGFSGDDSSVSAGTGFSW